MITTIPALVIARTYSAAPERLYEAWTTPEIAARFLGPDDIEARVLEMDVRVGGRYCIEMLHPGREAWQVAGEYREVVPHRRLVMTWRWLEDDPAEEQETLLTLDFKPAGSGTELTLTHAHLASDESRSGHERGWALILDALASLVAAR